MSNLAENWELSSFRIAAKEDLKHQIWEIWNNENPLPNNFWQRIWEYPWVFEHTKEFSSQLDVGGTYPFVLFKNWPTALSVDARNLNEIDHPLHCGLWPDGRLIVADATKIPLPDRSYDVVFCISSLEEMHDPKDVLTELLRIAKKRVVLTIDVGGNGLSPAEFEDVFASWALKAPKLSDKKLLTSLSPQILRWSQRLKWEYRKIRVVGIVLDRK